MLATIEVAADVFVATHWNSSLPHPDTGFGELKYHLMNNAMTYVYS